MESTTKAEAEREEKQGKVVSISHAPSQRNLVKSTSTIHADEYIELHAASAFSFLEGASHPEALIDRAVELGMPSMGLLDRNGVYGAVRFHAQAKKKGIRAHIGAEVALSSFGRQGFKKHYPAAAEDPCALRQPDGLSKLIANDYPLQNA